MTTYEPLTYAFCLDDEGLIRFGPRLPDGAYPLCHGTEADMQIVRRLAHRDGDHFYVPGNLLAKDREVVLERFAEACCERAEKPIPIVERRANGEVREYQSYDDWLRDALDCPGCG